MRAIDGTRPGWRRPRGAALLLFMLLLGAAGCIPVTKEPVFGDAESVPLEGPQAYSTESGAADGSMHVQLTPVGAAEFVVEVFMLDASGKPRERPNPPALGRRIALGDGWFAIALDEPLAAGSVSYLPMQEMADGFKAHIVPDRTLAELVNRARIDVAQEDQLLVLGRKVDAGVLRQLLRDLAGAMASGGATAAAVQFKKVAALDAALLAKGRDAAFSRLAAGFSHIFAATRQDARERFVAYFEELAAAGNPWGHYFLARIYINGTGVTRDLERGRRHAETAIAAGFERSKAALGFLYAIKPDPSPADRAEMMRLFEAAAKVEPAAMGNLAAIYLDPQNPARDETQGYIWQERAAQAFEPQSMYHLARRYMEGKGVARLPAEYFRFLTLAAEARYPPAVAELAYAHEFGIGTAVDQAKSIERLEEAVRLGDPWAKLRLAKRLLSGQGVDVDRKRALPLLEQAAAGGYAEAQKLLDQERSQPAPEAGQEGSPEYERMREAAIKTLEREFDRVKCQQIGETCRLNRDGDALIRLQHRDGWYFLDGRVAVQEEWPQ